MHAQKMHSVWIIGKISIGRELSLLEVGFEGGF
jgi:hypothetical protein